ncbi:hypothetical protein BCT73_05930 [Vibrio breoganii]|uniref:hypothetical protein n=1 Tax=Vibrio breoganii TaxID=553239 RepID=UPI000C836097|nr:hypothetical protein [Vibrio breoganii]PML61921.1 hypothetical protein BCT73_05930 [Vibrio breoganii]
MTTVTDKIKTGIEIVSDVATDGIEAVSSATSRAGAVVNRVAAMDEANVDHEVIALQMTKGSPNDHKYTEQDVQAYSKLYDDAKSGVPMTAKAARALVKDQMQNGTSKQKDEKLNIGDLSPQGAG